MDIIDLQALKADDVFGGETPRVEVLVQQVKNIVLKHDQDVTTREGRDKLKSVCYAIARSKTALDNLGKDYVAGIKAQAKKTDAHRKFLRESLDQFKTEYRKPLTEWENHQEQIKETILFYKEVLNLQSLDLQEINKWSEFSKKYVLDQFKQDQEYTEMLDLKVKANNHLIYLKEIAEKERKEKEELEQLRAEKQKREQEEREKEIAEKAADFERKKVELEQQQKNEREELEIKRRAENEILVKQKQKESIEGFVLLGFTEAEAKKIVDAIANRKIKNVNITY